MSAATEEVIQEIKEILGPDILKKSGAVFYSPLQSLTDNNGIYFLGYNPGGDPDSNSLPKIGDTLFTTHTGENTRDSIYNNYGGEKYKYSLENFFESINSNITNVICTNYFFIRSKKAKDIKISKKERDIYTKAHNFLINEIVNPSIIITFSSFVFDSLKNNKDLTRPKKIELIKKDGNVSKLNIEYYLSIDKKKLLVYIPHIGIYYSIYSNQNCNIINMNLAPIIQDILARRNKFDPIIWKFK